MADKTLVEFVRDALAAGSDRAAIAKALEEAGWSKGQIDDAIDSFADVAFPTPVPRPRLSVSAREAFLYLFTFIMLAIAAGHAVSLSFILIELFFPDPDATAGAFTRAEDGIRWAVAALVVAWPLYLWVTARVGRARRINPRMQRSAVRRWLTYIALVFAAGALAGDLISILYNFLTGDLTLNFFLKSLVVAAIAGAIFVHYVRDAERAEDDTAGRDTVGLALVGGATVLLAAAMITGLAMIDSPAAARDRRIDHETMWTLADLAGAVDCHWTVEGALPADLEALRARHDEGMDIPADPPQSCHVSTLTTPEMLEGVRLVPGDGASYQLCATFERDSDARDTSREWGYGGPSRRSLTASYEQGEQCFEMEALALVGG